MRHQRNDLLNDRGQQPDGQHREGQPEHGRCGSGGQQGQRQQRAQTQNETMPGMSVA